MAGIDAKTCLKDAEQEEWRDACWHRECSRPEDLLLAQAESEGLWLAVSVGAGAGCGAGAEAGAGRRAARRARGDEGNQGGRRTGLGGDETQ